MLSIAEIVADCISYSEEQNWFEYKDGWYEPDGIGEYISSLSNAAAMLGKEEGYLIWGIHNSTHELTDTKFNYHQDVKNEPLEHYLARNITPGIYFRFDEDMIDGKRVVVLRVPAAHTVPTVATFALARARLTLQSFLKEKQNCSVCLIPACLIW